MLQKVSWWVTVGISLVDFFKDENENLKQWRDYGEHELLTREMGSFTRTAMLRQSCHSEGQDYSKKAKGKPCFCMWRNHCNNKGWRLAGQQLCWNGPWGSGGHKQVMSQQHILAAEKAKSVLVCMNRSTARRWSSQATALVQLHLGYWAPSTGKISVNWSKLRRETSRCLGIWRAGGLGVFSWVWVTGLPSSNFLMPYCIGCVQLWVLFVDLTGFSVYFWCVCA